jgi:protein-disulfide isomerase
MFSAKQRWLGGTRSAITRLPLPALVVAFAGLFAAGVLSAGHLLDLPVPCGASRGCVTVAAHPASKVLGVPIAYFGVAAYLAIIFLLGRGADARWARVGLIALTGLGTLASAVLLVYSHQVIHATCPWCVASGGAMALLFLLAVAMLRARVPLRAVSPRMVWVLVYLTAGGLGVQAGMMERAASRPPIAAEHLAGVTAADLVDPAQSLGPAEAPVTVVVFADLWCAACRKACDSLLAYQRAHPAAVRLVYRHRPLWEISGHQFSGTAAALSEVAAERGQFWEFVELMHRQQTPLDAAGYLQLMRGLGFDPAQVEKRMNDPRDPAIVRAQRDKALAERLGIDATPTFLVLAGDHPPVSANQRTLPRVLNAPEVVARLAAAEGRTGARGAGGGAR